MTPLTLRSDRIHVEVDPGHGGDILQITDVASGAGILATTPWRARADSIRDRRMSPSAVDPTGRWLEQYRGGWQTLCPNAGAPRRVGGAEVGFHGEASVASWTLEENDDEGARLSLDLFSVPVRIERRLRVEGASLVQTDVLINLSDDAIDLDYVSHPAFGGALLDGRCRVATGATTFTPDVDESGGAPATPWPHLPQESGPTDLRVVPAPHHPSRVFGWLSGFTAGWYSISNIDRALGVRVEWDARLLPYAWWWQELNASAEHPWFRRARIMAVEPASTPTSGRGRSSTLTLAPSTSTEITITLTVTAGERGEQEG